MSAHWMIGVTVGLLVAGGLVLLALSWMPKRPHNPAREPLQVRWRRLTRRPPGRRGMQRDVKWALVVFATLTTLAVSGWVISLVVIPVAVLLVPWLLRNNTRAVIDRLAALEAWVRSIRSLLLGGSDNTLEAVLQSSLTTAPKEIRDEVSTLVARINARMSIDEALERFADDLDDPIGDVIAAALLLASRRRGTGLVDILEGLAESVSDEVAARRQIEADRSHARGAAVVLTILFAVVAAGSLLLNPAALQPYSTPIGQVVLLSIIVYYLCGLLLLRRLTSVKNQPRIYPKANSEVTAHA